MHCLKDFSSFLSTRTSLFAKLSRELKTSYTSPIKSTSSQKLSKTTRTLWRRTWPAGSVSCSSARSLRVIRVLWHLMSQSKLIEQIRQVFASHRAFFFPSPSTSHNPVGVPTVVWRGRQLISSHFKSATWRVSWRLTIASASKSTWSKARMLIRGKKAIKCGRFVTQPCTSSIPTSILKMKRSVMI